MPAQPEPIPDDLMWVNDYAASRGGSPNPRTIRRRIAKGVLSGYKAAGFKLMFSRSEADAKLIRKIPTA